MQPFFDYLKDRDRGLILCILALAGVIYLPFLGSAFFFDDSFYLSSRIMESAYFDTPHLDRRWLSLATLSWTWRLFLDTPLPYRLGNLALHAGNSILLFLLLKQLMIRTTADSRQVTMTAYLAAMIFCAHPVAVYAVGYVIQRSILLATFFVIAMHITYIKALLTAKGRWFLITVALYFMAIFSKEHAIMGIASLIAITVIFRERFQPNLNHVLLTWGGCLVFAAVVVLKTHGVIGVSYEVDANALLRIQDSEITHDNLHLLSVMTQMGLYFQYLLLWLFPNPAWMSVDMREPILTRFDAWQSWVGPMGYLAYGLVSLRLIFIKGRAAILGWAMLFPWLLFWTEFSTIRVQEPFVLYRSYLWLPGLAGAIACINLSIPRRKVLPICLMVVMVLVPLSWNRLWIYADHYRLWNDAAKLIESESTPGAARIFYNRGNAELARSEWQKARQDFSRVIRHSPEMEAPYNNLGIIDFNLGDYPAALDHFDQAIARNPVYAQAYFGKSVTLKRLGQEEASKEAMQKSCDLGHYVACALIQSHQAR